MRNATAYLCFTASLVLFGSNGIVASAIDLQSFQIVYLRTGIGVLMLLALLLASRKPLASRTHPRDLLFVALSGVAMGVGWLFLYEAYHRVGVGLSSLLYYCGPIIVMALSPVLFHERLTVRKVACFAVVLLGLVLVNGAVTGAALDVVGMALSVGSAVALAFLIVLNKKGPAITGLENSTWQLLPSFLTVAAFTVVRDGTPLVQVSAEQWPYVLFLGLVNTGLGCYLYFSRFDELPTQSVATLGYLEPLTAVVLGVMVLGEPMSLLQALGAVLIVGGAIACEAVKPAGRKVAGVKVYAMRSRQSDRLSSSGRSHCRLAENDIAS